MVEPKATVMNLNSFSWEPQETEVHLPVTMTLTPLQLGIELFNIPFDIRQGREFVFLESPQWPSLRTHGKNVAEAIDNMLSVIQEITQEYIFAEEASLAADAIAFRRFLIQKLLA
jgi:hypothetical protein